MATELKGVKDRLDALERKDALLQLGTIIFEGRCEVIKVVTSQQVDSRNYGTLWKKVRQNQPSLDAAVKQLFGLTSAEWASLSHSFDGDSVHASLPAVEDARALVALLPDDQRNPFETLVNSLYNRLGLCDT